MEIDPINGVNIYANIIAHTVHIVSFSSLLLLMAGIPKWFIASSSLCFEHKFSATRLYRRQIVLSLTRRKSRKQFSKEEVFSSFELNYYI